MPNTKDSFVVLIVNGKMRSKKWKNELLLFIILQSLKIMATNASSDEIA